MIITICLIPDGVFICGGAQGAENPQFDDSQWRKIDLPHDWSIEDLPGTKSPFSINAISQVSGGFTTGGYRMVQEIILIPANLKGKRFSILFEGVYMNAEVWLNGRQIGIHPYGYSTFWFDITDNRNMMEKMYYASRSKMKERTAAGIQDQESTGMSGFRLSHLFTLIPGAHILQPPKYQITRPW